MIVDHDMGFIHRAVVADIKKSYNVQTEVSLSYYGRADVVSQSSVWEVKHGSNKPIERICIAFAEACGYVALNRELSSVGKPGTFNGTIYIGCAGASYKVEYCTPYWGAILYFVREDPDYNGEYAVVYVPKKSESDARIIGMAGAVGIAGAMYTFRGTSGGGSSFGFSTQKYSYI